MLRILLAESLDESAEARLAAVGDVIRPVTSDENGLIAAIRDCEAIVARTHTPISRRVIDAGNRLRIIAVAGVGLDRVDLTAAAERCIEVLHAPAAASDAVAELAVALMLELLRPIRLLSADYAAGRYKQARAAPHGRELRELTVGIIGMGRIGSRVARISAAGFGAEVVFHDVAPVGPFEFPVKQVSPAELLKTSDIVSLHVPLTLETRGLIDARSIAQMKPTALLINTARGGVVDTQALTDSLVSGRLGGVGLDVTEPEPLPPGHPLFNHPRAILTPHVAARTFGGLQRMCDVVDDVITRLRALADESRP